jgi:glutathione peroxidase
MSSIMSINLCIMLCAMLLFFVVSAEDSIFNFNVENKNGEMISMREFADKKVIIVVNVASFCGYTYTNYKGLMELHSRYKDYGLEVIAFPSNQFGEQEPKSNNEIQQFCSNYGVQFPVMAKVDVNGPSAIPLYKYLKANAGKTEIQWNFNKFLVVDGKVVYRYGSNVKPEDMEEDILKYLGLGEDL